MSAEPFLSAAEDEAYAVIAHRLRHQPPLTALIGDMLQDRIVNALLDWEMAKGVEVEVDEAYACRTVARLVTFLAARAGGPRRGPPAAVADLVAYRARIGRPIRAERFL